MGIQLGSDFDVIVALPLDSRLKKADLIARDAIASGVRYEGMIVYVISDSTHYALKGGIANINWSVVGSGGGGASAATVTYDNTTSGLTATNVQAAIDEVDGSVDLKAPIASPTFTGTVSGITKAMVGLANVDNTTDLNKPVSTATQSALDLKAPIASPTFTGTVSGITKAMVGLGNVDNTSDATKNSATATLIGKTFDDELRLKELASTPTTPSAGYKKVYPKTDGRLYTLNSGGVEAEVGTGSGGGGSKNYFSSEASTFETTAGSWTQGGSGAAGLTVLRTATVGQVLSGNGSLRLYKNSSNGTGQYFSINLTTIDPSDRGRALYGSFNFKATDPTYSNYAAGDLAVEVYDVTNSAVLYSGLAEDLAIPATSGRFNFVTYTESTTATIQFRIKINSTSALQYEIYVDDLKLGPAAQISTVYKKSASINLSGSGAFSGGTIFVSRTGNQVNVRLTSAASFTLGTAASSAAGLIPEWARPTGTSGGTVDFFNATFVCLGTVETDGTLRYDFRTWNGVGSSNSTLSSGDISFAASDLSGPTMNDNELSNQTVGAKLSRTTAQSIPTGTYTKVLLNSVGYDDQGITDTTNNQIVIPKSGKLTFNLFSYFTTGATGIRSHVLYNATTATYYLGSQTITNAPASGSMLTSTSYTDKFTKGHIIQLFVYHTQGAALNLTEGALTVTGHPDYTVIGAVRNSEYVESKNSVAAAYPIATGAWGDLTSIVLGAGEWNVVGLSTIYAVGVPGATRWFQAAIGLNSGTTATDLFHGDNLATNQIANTSGEPSSAVVPGHRLVLTAPTTVYLKGRVSNTTNIQTLGYSIKAWRVK